MPSGLGPYFDCSDLGVAISIDRARRDEADRDHIMEAEKRDVLSRISRGESITPDEYRIYGLDDRVHFYKNISKR